MSLVELMIGLLLAGLLLVQAVPGTASWIARYRVGSQAGVLASVLSYARSEAITRGLRVAVCTTSAPNAASPTCDSSGNWANGWLVFVDNVQVAGNAPGVIDGDDRVLRTGDRVPNAVATADAAVQNWIAFSSDGLWVGSGGRNAATIDLCLQSQRRLVRLGTTGSVTTEAGSC